MVETTFILQRVGKRNFARTEDVITSIKSVDKLEKMQIIQTIELEIGLNQFQKKL